MNIQWFPGHMAKTARLIKENLKLADIIVELLDARVPISSKNPDIDDMIQSKPRVIILNKADLADEKINNDWIRYFESINIPAILFDSTHAKNTGAVTEIIKKVLKDKIDSLKAKGMINRSIKMMIVGIPNVGKSSFINKLVGKATAITGDRPGVTRGKQWIRIKQGFEILDTPGILWPKFEDENTGLRLAFIGSVKDEIIDTETLGAKLLDFLNLNYSDCLKSRYKLKATEGLDGFKLLEAVAKSRGFLVSGGDVDTLRASNIVLDEFRASRLGRISIEKPEDLSAETQGTIYET